MGEALLTERFREMMDRTQGVPTAEDKATLVELCLDHGIPRERAQAIVHEVQQWWREAHERRPRGTATKTLKQGEVVTNSLGILTKGFWLGVTPVTQGQWEAVMGDNPSSVKGDDRPVEMVGWLWCQRFCQKLASRDKHYRLPTEAEWEYACRAGTTTPFYFGGTISTDQANYCGYHAYTMGKEGVFRNQTTPVGRFPPNAWGLFDMHGNVAEWCLEWYGPYPKNLISDPQGSNSPQPFGGGWTACCAAVPGSPSRRTAAPLTVRRVRLTAPAPATASGLSCAWTRAFFSGVYRRSRSGDQW
jgi:hypothetical protein